MVLLSLLYYTAGGHWHYTPLHNPSWLLVALCFDAKSQTGKLSGVMVRSNLEMTPHTMP